MMTYIVSNTKHRGMNPYCWDVLNSPTNVVSRATVNTWISDIDIV